jgi:MFS family permease
MEIGVWVLRVFGALYLFGAFVLVRAIRMDALLDKALASLEGMNAELDGEEPAAKPIADDRGRRLWMYAGALLTALSGLAMVLAHSVAVWLLAALVLQQMGYFIRQRLRERAATSPQEAEDARPTRETQNAFVGSLGLLVLAGWLQANGALT